jgi:hypothetical protein
VLASDVNLLYANISTIKNNKENFLQVIKETGLEVNADKIDV